jgi:Neuraminidase (sialidase)
MLLGDPVAKCTSAHDFFISSLFENCTDSQCDTGTNGVSVSASTDGGKNFGAPVAVVNVDFNQDFIDKDWMTVDPSNPSDVYVTYTDYQISSLPGGCNGPYDFLSSIYIVASTDGGAHFGSPELVTPQACDESLTGSQAVVGPDGTVYVAWETIGSDVVTREIDIANSSNSFSSPVTVSSVECSGDCFELQGMIRSNEFPSLTINHKGVLFMTWQDGDVQMPDALAYYTSDGFTDHYGFTDIEFSKSKDGGATWSTPVRVNTNPASKLRDHFEPTIAVGSGRVAICFYDRRNDPRNFKIDRYCANSTNGGATWTNTRITGNNFPSVVGQDVLLYSDYMGDYDAMAADTLGRHSGFIDSYATNAPGYPRAKANKF